MRKLLVLPLALAAALAGGAVKIVQDQCGPFTDVTPAFCPYILELYYMGITAGTSATTFSPDDPLTRGQGAVFIAKGLNQSVARSSPRAALGQWWMSQDPQNLPITHVPRSLRSVVSDGSDVWVAGSYSAFQGSDLAGAGQPAEVFRFRGSDGRLLETWTLPDGRNSGILVAIGRVFTAIPGGLYMLDPTQPPSDMTLVASVGDFPSGIAFDGSRIWIANESGSVSIVTPGSSLPWAVTSVTSGFQNPYGVLFDGSNVWVTDFTAQTLLRLNSNGAIVQTVPVGVGPAKPVFDGSNIWVPNNISGTLSVVAASTGQLVATLSGNGLEVPSDAAFDGQRILVVGGNSHTLSLWKAADLSPVGSLPYPNDFPQAVCSDGVSFFIALYSGNFIRL